MDQIKKLNELEDRIDKLEYNLDLSQMLFAEIANSIYLNLKKTKLKE